MPGRPLQKEQRFSVTDRIIAQLEAGQIPWYKPWIASGQAVSRSTGEKIQDPFLRDYS